MLETLHEDADIKRMSLDQPEQENFFDTRLEISSEDREQVIRGLDILWDEGLYTSYLRTFLVMKKIDPGFDLEPKPDLASKAFMQNMDAPFFLENVNVIYNFAALKQLYPDFLMNDVIKSCGSGWKAFVRKNYSQREYPAYAELVVAMKQLGFPEHDLLFDDEVYDDLKTKLDPQQGTYNEYGTAGLAASLKILRPDKPIYLSKEQWDEMLKTLKKIKQFGDLANFAPYLESMFVLNAAFVSKSTPTTPPMPEQKNF